MKVVMISSSPNEIGLTNSCVEVCRKALEKNKIETEWIVLNHYHIKKCEACGERGWGICLEKHQCRMDDDFNVLKKRIDEFDAIIVVSPVYFYEMSEVAKTFFDRLKRCESFDKDSKLKGKNMLCIACAGGSGDGTENTLTSMRFLAKFLHMNVVKQIGVTKMNFEDIKSDLAEGCRELIFAEKMRKLVDLHFSGQVKIGSSEMIEKKDYAISYSKFIQDCYWNMAHLKNVDIHLEKVWQNIKNDMKELNRQPILYLTSNIDDEKVEKQLKNCSLENLYTDAWMMVEDLKNFKNYESKIDVEISQVKEEEKEEFIGAIMDGFSSDDPEDPYGTLPEEYREIYHLEFEDPSYHKLEYCGKYQGKMIATANLWWKEECAIIYTVSTSKKYQRKGVCKKMMSHIIKDLESIGIKTVCVQTEEGFYTEKVYESMGFRKVMLGRAYAEK